MAPKPTVQLLLTSPTILAPGDHVTGKLVVDVVGETFELTGIYLDLVGAEYSVSDGRSDHSDDKLFFNHVELHRTLYGLQKSSGNSGGAMLAPGHYEYPFDLQVPYGAPPSYSVVVRRGRSRLQYTLRGVLSVPLFRSIAQKIDVTVVPVASFEQVQFAREHTLTSPAVEVPVTHLLGLSTSKTQSVKLEVQMWPSVVVLGGTMADEYYSQRRQMAEGRGAVVRGETLDGDDATHGVDAQGHTQKQATNAKTMGLAKEDADGEVRLVGAEVKNGEDQDPNEALLGKVVRLYQHNEETDFPFKPSVDKPGVVCARVIVENRTKDKFSAFEIALRQLRTVNVRNNAHWDKVSLSKVSVQLPSGCVCKPGERVAVDVELPMRRDLTYQDPSVMTWFKDHSKIRRQPSPTLQTQAYTCENVLQVTLPKISLKSDVGQFPSCVQFVEVVGVPGAPYVAVPTVHQALLALRDDNVG